VSSRGIFRYDPDGNLTPDFLTASQRSHKKKGVANRTAFQRASASALPFEDGGSMWRLAILCFMK